MLGSRFTRTTLPRQLLWLAYLLLGVRPAAFAYAQLGRLVARRARPLARTPAGAGRLHSLLAAAAGLLVCGAPLWMVTRGWVLGGVLLQEALCPSSNTDLPVWRRWWFYPARVVVHLIAELETPVYDLLGAGALGIAQGRLVWHPAEPAQDLLSTTPTQPAWQGVGPCGPTSTGWRLWGY